MCWSINKIEFESNPEKYHKIAEEDITVYKFGHILDGKFIPYFKCDFTYTVNSLNEEVKLILEEYDEIFFDSLGLRLINEGYHSYVNEEKAFYELKILIDSYYSNYGKTSCVVNYSISKFIIPKGSEYYENEDGEIVSSQLMWTGEFNGRALHTLL